MCIFVIYQAVKFLVWPPSRGRRQWSRMVEICFNDISRTKLSNGSVEKTNGVGEISEIFVTQDESSF